jgi:hypothetical protein
VRDTILAAGASPGRRSFAKALAISQSRCLLTGSPNFDAHTLKQADSHAVHSIQKKSGKVVGATTRTVPKDGSEPTLASKGTGADGVAYDT